MRLPRRDLRTALLVVLVAVVALVAGRLLTGPADEYERCVSVLERPRGNLPVDAERACGHLR